jgi:hypothetical protein
MGAESIQYSHDNRIKKSACFAWNLRSAVLCSTILFAAPIDQEKREERREKKGIDEKLVMEFKYINK